MSDCSDSDEEQNDEEKSLKIVLLGDSGCGKTALCTKFTQQIFHTNYTQTAGVDFFSKRITLPEKKSVLLQLWDVGGHNIASPVMLNTYVFGAQAVFFVYDVTNTQSFENVCDWISIVKKIVHQIEKPFHMCLVGSKTDMEHRRVISIQKNNKGAEQYGLDPFYVSAKTGDNVVLMFKSVSAKILGVKLTRADQEWNVNVVQAPIESDFSSTRTPTIQYNKKSSLNVSIGANKNSENTNDTPIASQSLKINEDKSASISSTVLQQ